MDAAAPAAGQAAPWAHVWRVIHTSHLDRLQRITAWRLLHGKLLVGAFSQHIRRADPAGHSCPHSGCESQPATLTQIFITCFLAAGVWDWHAATWAAVTGENAPPRSTDLLLADDTRMWEPPRQLRPLWQLLRLATICQLWAAYQRGRHQPDAHTSPGQLAARILSSCRKASWPTGDLPPPTSGCQRACSATGSGDATPHSAGRSSQRAGATAESSAHRRRGHLMRRLCEPGRMLTGWEQRRALRYRK